MVIFNKISALPALKQLFALLCMCFLVFTPKVLGQAAGGILFKPGHSARIMAEGTFMAGVGATQVNLPKIDINLTEINIIIHEIPDLSGLALPEIDWVSLNASVHAFKIPDNIIAVLNQFTNGTNITTIGQLADVIDKDIPASVINALLKQISPTLTKEQLVAFLKGALYQDTPLQTLLDIIPDVQKYDITKITIANVAEIMNDIVDLQQNVDALLSYFGIKLKVDMTKVIALMGKAPISIPAAYDTARQLLAQIQTMTVGQVANLINLIPTDIIKALNITPQQLATLKKYIGWVDPTLPVNDILKTLNAMKAYDLRTMTVANLLTVIETIPDQYLEVTVNTIIQNLIPGSILTWTSVKNFLAAYTNLKISTLINLI